MAWQLTRNLDALRDEIKRGMPNVTIYTIGDEAHRLRSSDHNPDDTSGSLAAQSDSDSLQEVRAIDIMLNVSTLSMRIVGALIDPRSRGRLKYVIHGGKIWSRSNGWAVQSFTSDPHNDHIHVSGLAADDANGAGWPAVAELWEEDVTPEDISAIKSAILGDGGMQLLFARVAALTSGADPAVPGTTQPNALHQKLNALAQGNTAAQTKLNEINAEAEAAREAELQRDANLAAAVDQVDDLVAARLGDGDLTAAQKAEILRPVLGDDAAAVGALLAQG